MKTWDYPIACAEVCGLNHFQMAGKVTVLESRMSIRRVDQDAAETKVRLSRAARSSQQIRRSHLPRWHGSRSAGDIREVMAPDRDATKDGTPSKLDEGKYGGTEQGAPRRFTCILQRPKHRSVVESRPSVHKAGGRAQGTKVDEVRFVVAFRGRIIWAGDALQAGSVHHDLFRRGLRMSAAAVEHIEDGRMFAGHHDHAKHAGHADLRPEVLELLLQIHLVDRSQDDREAVLHHGLHLPAPGWSAGAGRALASGVAAAASVPFVGLLKGTGTVLLATWTARRTTCSLRCTRRS